MTDFNNFLTIHKYLLIDNNKLLAFLAPGKTNKQKKALTTPFFEILNEKHSKQN